VLLLALTARPLAAQPAPEQPSARSSAYLPVDSWVYPAMLRLYSLGYARTAYLGLRPWTRRSALAMLSDAGSLAVEPEAEAILDRLLRELSTERDTARLGFEPESLYTRVRAIHGPVLDDGFHVGQTFVNDYGRPDRPGFNDATGLSARLESGRFSLSTRVEFERAPSGMGYAAPLGTALAGIDMNPDGPQSTIPAPLIAGVASARVIEANLSAHVAGHEISFGKSDTWFGPGLGGGMAWSDDAENIYSLRVDRVQPLHIPGLSRWIGDVRYVFLVGSLKGHSFPNDPWIHAEKLSFKPVPDLEFGFERTVIWGGKGHVPITAGTFLRSFFSVAGVAPPVKFSRSDPGARFSAFDLAWRLPGLRSWVTVYTDSIVHDNVSPVSNPPRAGLRPGVYLAKFPKLHALDLRVEGVSSDPISSDSSHGRYLYYESVQTQGYTNKGHPIGDWIGREAKGGQAWLTWHRDGLQQVQLTYRNAKADIDFIPGGTTQHDFALSTTLRVGHHWQIDAQGQVELWKVPLLAAGQQRNISSTLQLTYLSGSVSGGRR
jgi:hypothetical protein